MNLFQFFKRIFRISNCFKFTKKKKSNLQSFQSLAFQSLEMTGNAVCLVVIWFHIGVQPKIVCIFYVLYFFWQLSVSPVLLPTPKLYLFNSSMSSREFYSQVELVYALWCDGKRFLFFFFSGTPFKCLGLKYRYCPDLILLYFHRNLKMNKYVVGGEHSCIDLKTWKPRSF